MWGTLELADPVDGRVKGVHAQQADQVDVCTQSGPI
jgi:hypothetical protein